MDTSEIEAMIQRLPPLRKALVALAVESFVQNRDGIGLALCGMARERLVEDEDLQDPDQAVLERLAAVASPQELVLWARAYGQVWEAGDRRLAQRLERLAQARVAH